MASNTLFILASALFVQSALSQCLRRIGTGWGYDGLDYAGAWNGRLDCGCGGIAPAAELAASYGGGLDVTSSSCATPTGLAVTSKNSYEGCVGVVGNLPFLGTADVEGVFSTAGAGAINYECGDGIVSITAEGPINGAIVPDAAIAPAGIASFGLGYRGNAGRGCGCGCGGIY